MSGLSEAERAVVEAMRSHSAHGFGEIRIVFTDGAVDVQEGRRTRFRTRPAGVAKREY